MKKIKPFPDAALTSSLFGIYHYGCLSLLLFVSWENFQKVDILTKATHEYRRLLQPFQSVSEYFFLYIPHTMKSYLPNTKLLKSQIIIRWPGPDVISSLLLN